MFGLPGDPIHFIVFAFLLGLFAGLGWFTSSKIVAKLWP